MRPPRGCAELGALGCSARVSGVTASLADETVPQTSGNALDIAAAATEALAVAALRVGFGLMTIAAASDTAFALIDGGGLLAGIEGIVLTGLAIGGLLRPAAASRLLRPPGRVVIAAALFALAGAFDWGHPEPLLRGSPRNRVDRRDCLLATVDRGLRSCLRSRLSRRPSTAGPFPRVDTDPDRMRTRDQPVDRPRRERRRRARAGRALAPVHRRCTLKPCRRASRRPSDHPGAGRSGARRAGCAAPKRRCRPRRLRLLRTPSRRSSRCSGMA